MDKLEGVMIKAGKEMSSVRAEKPAVQRPIEARAQLYYPGRTQEDTDVTWFHTATYRNINVHLGTLLHTAPVATRACLTVLLLFLPS